MAQLIARDPQLERGRERGGRRGRHHARREHAGGADPEVLERQLGRREARLRVLHLLAQHVGERGHLVAPQLVRHGDGSVRHPPQDRRGEVRIGAGELYRHEAAPRVRRHLQLARQQLRRVVRGVDGEVDGATRVEHGLSRHPREPQGGADRVAHRPTLHHATPHRNHRKAPSLTVHFEAVAARDHPRL